MLALSDTRLESDSKTLYGTTRIRRRLSVLTPGLPFVWYHTRSVKAQVRRPVTSRAMMVFMISEVPP
jgi:hypothetical protein